VNGGFRATLAHLIATVALVVAMIALNPIAEESDAASFESDGRRNLF
jgi:hypothetical protein